MEKTKKPNILFLLTDDQRYNTIHALGNEAIVTPNMDKLVNQGTAFTHAHIPGGTVGAVCMPSRAMINTGRTLFHLQDEGANIPQDHITLGETLKENDYYCFGTGKWHNGPAAFTRSFTQGDNAFFGGMWDHWNVPTNHYDPTGEYDNVINFVANFHKTNKVLKVHCDKFNPGKHSTELITDTVVDFINNTSTKKPMFMYTAYLAPHDPRTMPDRFKKMYNPEDIKLPENFVENPENFGVADIRDEVLAAYPRNPEEIKKHIAEYYGMISHLDFEIGRIFEALDKKGELENTIIILAGDNGLAIGNHGLMGKQNHYEHSIRVPLVFAGKGIPKGKKVDNLVYLMDIYPTLCELLGFEIPESVEGKSFAKSFEDASFKSRDSLYFAYQNILRSVKDERYKLIEYRNFVKKSELFDLDQDPEEMNNLIDDANYAEKIKELKAKLFEFRDNWDDKKHKYGKEYWDNY